MKKAISPVIAVILLLSVTVVISVLVFNGIEDITQTTQDVLGGENALQNSITIKTLFDNTLFLTLDRAQNFSAVTVKTTKGAEVCTLSGAQNINDSLLIHYTFDNLTFNGSNYFVPDVSGNNRDALILSQPRWSGGTNFTALGGTNTTYIHFLLRYHFLDPTGMLNGCYALYGNQSSRILRDEDNTNVTYARNFYLETPLVGMASGESFSYVCNQTSPFEVDEGRIYLDGLDDHFYVENSSNFLETYIEHDKNFTMAYVVESDRVDDYYFEYATLMSTRANACGGDVHMTQRVTLFDIYQNATSRLILGGFFFVNHNKKYYTVITTVNSQNGTINGSFYLNGALISTIVNMTEFNSAGNELAFGTSRGCNNIHYKGYFDEVRIYNRTLSREEAEALHWHFESNRGPGNYQLDLYSCNLQKGENYDIEVISEGIKERKRFYYR